MEGIAIGINLSGNMISDVKHNRNAVVLLELCESLTSDRVDRARYTIYRGVFKETRHGQLRGEMMTTLLSLIRANCKTLLAKECPGPVPPEYENNLLIRQQPKSIREQRTPRKYTAQP